LRDELRGYEMRSFVRAPSGVVMVVVLQVLLAGHVGRETKSNRHADEEAEQETHRTLRNGRQAGVL
jgi:hypothetical protein